MKKVTFYHSVICPRCQMASRSIAALQAEFPGVEIERVEFLANRARARQAGVRQIPALVAAEGASLSSFYLTRGRIREFLESVSRPARE